ncbi:MAG: VCBS repeat-containing protein [bacterium]|nr:VCBS repeat-containing protein [bacterium]
MSSSRSSRVEPTVLNQVLPSTPTILVAICLLAPSVAVAGGGSDWVEYVDESSTRIVADAGVGQIDEEEKDLIAGDVDKDGDTDLIIVRKVPFTNAGGWRNVLFMNESGVMTDRTSTLAPDFMDQTNDRDVLLVDVDGDTWLDVVTATTFEEQPRVLMNRGENGGGTWLGFEWQDAGRLPTISPAPFFCALGFGDVTGDQAPDLYFVDYDNNTEDRLLINNGNGFFTDQTTSRLAPGMADSVFGSDAHIVDVNGDGWNDIVKNNASGNNPPPGFQPRTTVLYNDGTGNFAVSEDIYTAAPYMIEPADFTGDGRLDFFIVDDGQDAYLINDGNGGDGFANFTTQAVATSPNTVFFGGNVKFADIDHDGILDVLVADVDTDIPGCDRELALLRGAGPQPNVTYSDPLVGAPRAWLPSGVFDIEALHIDDDGVLDLWVGTCDGNQVFMGSSPGVFINGFESGDLSFWD